jgi:hypothetical protein
VLAFATLVMALTLAPYLLGYATQSDTWTFTGFVFGVEDGNSYIAKMLSGSAGAWLFRTPYTPETQRGILAFLPYILLGKLASPPGLHEQLVALFHLFRLGAGMLDILATYCFIAFFIRPVSLRRAGLLLASLGGGLGWLLVLLGEGQWLGSLPLDFYSPETFGFLALFGLPHLALARAGLLYGMVSYLSTWRSHNDSLWKPTLRLGLSWMVVALAQPLTALVMGFVLAIHWLSMGLWQVWHRRKGPVAGWGNLPRSALLLLAAGLLPGAFLAYTFILFQIDPFLKGWTAQNIITSPHPAHYLLAFGLVIPFVILGGKNLLIRSAHLAWMPIVWVMSFPFLAYAPVNLQRRLPEGVWVALVVLAMASFGDLRPPSKWQYRLSWGLAIASTPSTIFLFLGGILAAIQPVIPVFRPAEEVAAFQFLGNNANPGDVVLTSYLTGNALPAWAAVRVVVGHGPESVGLPVLLKDLEKVHDQETPEAERRGLFELWGVRFVFHGPNETELGAWSPQGSGYLIPVYQAGGYEIYQVIGQ